MSHPEFGIKTALEQATAHMGAGHNAFVYVPQSPLMAEDAADRPLGALRLAVKDVIDCATMPTGVGSRFTTVQPRSAAIVEQLVAQGAAVLGKTQAHQFSFGTTGDVSFSGPVRNARDATLMAGGSSGGSAVAVALGVVDAAVGTDTAGSVRIPAALNGVVGFKPTYGALSSDGIFPLAPSLDTPGLLARDVTTITKLWAALKPNTADPLAPVDKPRLGVLSPSSLSGMASSIHDTFTRVVKALKPHAGQAVTTLDVDLQALRTLYRFIIGWEASMVHGGWTRVAPQYYHDEILQRIRDLAGVTHDEYVNSLLEARRHRESLVSMFDDVDVLVSPTLAIETPRLGQRTVQDDSGLDQVWGALAHFTSPWNVVGFPAISLPMPHTPPHVPVGLQLIGKPGADAQLLQVAQTMHASLEQVSL